MRLTAIAVAVVAGLAAPAAASAADYCIGVQPEGVTCTTVSGDTPGDKLEAALAAAETSGSFPSVYLAEGAYVGTFARTQGSGTVTVVGSGPETVLEAEGAHAAFTASKYTRLEALTLGAGAQSAGEPLLTVADEGAGLVDVALEGDDTGVAVDAARLDRFGYLGLLDVSIAGAFDGVRVGNGPVEVIDSRVQAIGVALEARDGAGVTVARSTLETTTDSDVGAFALRNIGADVEVDASVLRTRSSKPDAQAIKTECGADSATTSVSGSTLATVRRSGLRAACTEDGRRAEIAVAGSILAPGTQPDTAGTGATVALSDTRWDGDGGTPIEGVTTDGAMRTDDPGFVAADDLRLRPGSPLVDTLPPTALDSEALKGSALGAVARVLDGNGDGVARPDYGAYETLPPAGPPTAGNLLVNGDAERGVDGEPPAGWVAAEALTARYVGGPLIPGVGLAYGAGTQFFANAGQAPPGTLRQTTDLTGGAAVIDGPGTVATLSGLLGGYAAPDSRNPKADSATVTATFRDAAGDPLGTAMRIGPITPAELGDVAGLARRTATAPVPSGARSVETVLAFVEDDDEAFTSAYADELSLTLADNPAPADPGTGGGGGGGGTGGGGVLPSRPVAAPPAPPAYAGLALRGGKLKLDAKGRVTVPVACPATAVGGCIGTLELSRAGSARAAAKRKRAVRLARANVAVAAGKTQRVRLKLSRKARRGLRRNAKVTLKLVTRDGRPGPRSVTRTRTVRLVVSR